jgi:hypothetical protein
MHAPLLSPVHATWGHAACTASIFLDLVGYRNSISATYSLFRSSAISYLVPLRSIYFPQHPFSNSLILCSSLNAEYHVPRPACHTHTHQLNLKNVLFFSLYFLNIQYCVREEKGTDYLCCTETGISYWMWSELKHLEPTSKFATIVFIRFLPYNLSHNIKTALCYTAFHMHKQ